MAGPTRVDLSEMGRWGKQVRVAHGDQYEEVWVQTVGDRTEAIEHGHEAMQRKLLEFREGDERDRALREALGLAPVEDLVSLVVEGERAKMESSLRREMPDPVTPRQDMASGETGGQFLARLNEHHARCQELRRARGQRLDELLEARREELLGRPKEELVELARPRRIDIECWNAFARTCDDWVLLRAVRRAEDHSQAYFDDIGQVQGLHPGVKEQLRRAYREVDPPEDEALPKS